MTLRLLLIEETRHMRRRWSVFLSLAAAAAGFCGGPYTSADADPSPANAHFLDWASDPLDNPDYEK